MAMEIGSRHLNEVVVLSLWRFADERGLGDEQYDSADSGQR